MRKEVPFNPLDLTNLAISIIQALLSRPIEPLPPTESFMGAGIYAIYYLGNYPAYLPIALQNRSGRFSTPIYVGKAVPRGARRTGFGLAPSTGSELYGRLFEHAASLRQVSNLSVEDFQCRYLVVQEL